MHREDVHYCNTLQKKPKHGQWCRKWHHTFKAFFFWFNVFQNTQFYFILFEKNMMHFILWTRYFGVVLWKAFSVVAAELTCPHGLQSRRVNSTARINATSFAECNLLSTKGLSVAQAILGSTEHRHHRQRKRVWLALWHNVPKEIKHRKPREETEHTHSNVRSDFT